MQPEPNRDAAAGFPPPGRPGIVGATAACLLVWGLLAAFAAVLMFAGYAVEETTGASAWVLRFHIVWEAGWCIALTGPLRQGRRWAWAATMALLFVWLTFCAAGITEVGSKSLVTALGMFVVASIPLSVIPGFFRARWWFGVGPRQGWRTLLREGGWMLGVTTALYLIEIVLRQLHS